MICGPVVKLTIGTHRRPLTREACAMDRLDAMKVFIAALDEGSLAGASRKTGRSAAAVSRAVAFLEARVGVPLLHRTTRSIRLSEAGERYALACRKILADLEEADRQAAGERSVPRGTLTITSTVFAGVEILRPIVDAFMDEYPTVTVRMHMLERPVNLIDEGMDLALRITHLADSTLVAHRIGEVRKVVVASPKYLATQPRIVELADLAKQRIIAMAHMGLDSWSFPPLEGSSVPRSVSFTPRLVIDNIQAAVASAVEGHGVTRLFSYHVAREIEQGLLRIVLADAEPAPTPVHLVSPYGRLAVPKVRAFVDFALPRLRSQFADLVTNAETPANPPIPSPRGRMSAE
ncbi:LysR family transcriptional regulator [Rhodanobacter ginsengisoli]|uniref:LysR family transcriptional regulator n=1 Tax=Rhodanobacter ginsengisoli TaxID=418646 RepID=A0ABW0QMQ3_9GAMM